MVWNALSAALPASIDVAVSVLLAAVGPVVVAVGPPSLTSVLTDTGGARGGDSVGSFCAVFHAVAFGFRRVEEQSC